MENEKTATAKTPATMAEALIVFRSKIRAVKKNEDNPFFKSKYADLPSILDAIREPMTEAGLALHHRTVIEDGHLYLRTVLVGYGESIESVFPIFGNKPQEIGSSMTYARRYNAQALLDVPTEEDDDGNKANTATPTAVQKTPEKPKEIKWLNKTAETKQAVANYIEQGYTANQILDQIEKSGFVLSKNTKEEIISGTFHK